MDRKSILTEVEADMKTLYGRLVKRSVERTDADSLANVAGKRLKAVQLDIAHDITTGKLTPPDPTGLLTSQ